MEIYEALVTASKEALADIEPETRDHLTEHLKRSRSRFGKTMAELENVLTESVLLAMLTNDLKSMRLLVANAAFNGFLLCWLMVNGIDPKVIDELEKRGPDKFDREAGMWMEDNNGTDNPGEETEAD